MWVEQQANPAARGLFGSCLYHFIRMTLQVTCPLGALVSSSPIKMSVYAVTGTEEALGGFSSWPPSLGSSVFLSQNSFQFTGTPPPASTRRHHARH